MKERDTTLYDLIDKETQRQREGIELIPSENYASAHVREALSSVLVNKYSEGYPRARYYGGNEIVDEVEILAQERAKKLFGVPYANVQPYSGSPANFAVYMATCKPGDPVMGLALTSGGHLTHGFKVSASGIFYDSLQYGLRQEIRLSGGRARGAPTSAQGRSGRNQLVDEHLFGAGRGQAPTADLFDYDEILSLAKKHRPRLIWVGTTAYPLTLHYDKFAEIAGSVGAYLAADIAHIAGLIVGGAHPSPVPYVDIVTTTTHKTLRGPRGAIIMVTEKGLAKDPELAEKIDKAVFPGLQGGPHDNQTAAIAVALYEAARPEFKTYALQVVKNARTLAKVLIDNGFDLVGSGTDTHLILVDLSSIHGPGAGVFAQKALDMVGLTVNKNTIPDDPSSPFFPSGIRLGSPAATTRGMKEKEMTVIGSTIVKVLNILLPYRLPTDKKTRSKYIADFEKSLSNDPEIKKLRTEIKSLGLRFPIP